jgi:hypothetical protein
MFIALGIGSAGLIAGITAAALSDTFPRYHTVLQECGGGLVVGSVSLLGFAFFMI